jgi:hypothetical protein
MGTSLIEVPWDPPAQWPEATSVVEDFWHHGPPGRSVYGAPEIAPADARYHRGGSGAWHATVGTPRCGWNCSRPMNACSRQVPSPRCWL